MPFLSIKDLDIFAVSPMDSERWNNQSPKVWENVHSRLRGGWSGKLDDAHRLAAMGAFNFKVAKAANELGAPVGNLFTVFSLAEMMGLHSLPPRPEPAFPPEAYLDGSRITKLPPDSDDVLTAIAYADFVAKAGAVDLTVRVVRMVNRVCDAWLDTLDLGSAVAPADEPTAEGEAD
jgi:hypothetical protein